MAPSLKLVEPDQFRVFADKGFKERLIPIVPPDAKVSERSKMFARVGKPGDGRGKAPGVLGYGGEWFGMDFVNYVFDETDLPRWRQMGAGVGIKTGDGLAGIDADAPNIEHARIIKDEIESFLGKLPVRIGRYPKALYLCRVEGDFKYQRVDFGGENDRVEILYDKKQFVASGIHPATREAYSWPQGLPAFSDLPVIPAAKLVELLERLARLLPAAKVSAPEGGGEQVDQEKLKGDPALVAKAVRATPNTSKNFSTRESYRDFGYAIKASIPDDPDQAFEIYSEWCGRWEDDEHGRTNDLVIVESDWRRMKPPFRIGADYIYRKAEKFSDGQFSIADLWFEEIPPEKPLTDDGAECDDDEPSVPPQMLIKRIVPKQGVCFVGGQSGAGKTFMICDMAVSLASGADFFRHKVKEKVGVVILAGEGRSTLKRRIKAARTMKADYGALPIRWWGDIPNLKEKTGFEATVRRLRASAKIFQDRFGVRLGVIFVDTVAACFSMKDENDNSEATEITKVLAALGRALGCVVIPVHHYGKGQETGLRGASAWRANVDVVLSVTCTRNQVTGATSEHYLSLAKARDGEEGPIAPFALRTVVLGVDEDGENVTTCYVVGGEPYQGGDGVAAAERIDDGTAAAREKACLQDLSSGAWRWESRKREEWAGVVVGRHFGFEITDRIGRERAKTILEKWSSEGVIERKKRLDANRHNTDFVEVCGQAVQKTVENTASDLFDGLSV